MSLTFNNLLSVVITSISTSTTSAVANSTTSSITASGTNVNGGTLTYLWNQTGTSCSINSSTSSTTTFTGSGTVGTTNVYCTVTNSATGVSSLTPTCVITWTTIPITSMSFTLNGSPFTTNQTVSSGPNYTIAVGSVVPGGATYSPSSTTVSAAGSYSLTSSGTGNYSGTFTSPTLTISTPISGSISDTPISNTQHSLTASLSGATATGYTWSRVSGTLCSFTSPNSATTLCNESGSSISTTTVQCVITYSGGSVTPTATIQWGAV